MLRISSPAPTSSTSPIAVSAITSVLCNRHCLCPPWLRGHCLPALSPGSVNVETESDFYDKGLILTP